MELKDVDAVTELARQLGYPVFSAEVRVRLERIKETGQKTALLVAEVDGVVAGWIQVSRDLEVLTSKPRAEVTTLVVDEKVRGKGIGAKLLAAAENWARENELDLVRLRTNVNRKDAHRFYLREGYELVKSWHLFAKRLEE